MISIETIRKRKEIYGNNFPKIAELQSEYYGFTVSSEDVAKSLAILKQVRVEFIKSKLQEFREDINFSTNSVQKQIKELNEGLEDSKKDFENYLWIANNYAEYEAL
jgi:gas vesicle protein